MGVITENIGQSNYAAANQSNTYTARLSIDVRGYRSLAISAIATVQNVKWTVHGANQSDYSDEVTVQAEATITVGTPASYSQTQAPFGYYRVKTKNAVDDVVGQVALQAYAKP